MYSTLYKHVFSLTRTNIRPCLNYKWASYLICLVLRKEAMLSTVPSVTRAIALYIPLPHPVLPTHVDTALWLSWLLWYRQSFVSHAATVEAYGKEFYGNGEVLLKLCWRLLFQFKAEWKRRGCIHESTHVLWQMFNGKKKWGGGRELNEDFFFCNKIFNLSFKNVFPHS